MRYQRSLSRRTFLRGAGGVSIALPFLDEMRTRSVWAAPADPPVRAFNVFLGGGVPVNHQRAGLVGPLAPLVPLKDKMAFIRGIQGPDGHPVGAGAAFVGKSLVNDTTAGGPSLDNMIMRHAYPMGGRPTTPIDVQGMGFYYKFLDNPSRWVKSWDEQGRPKGGLVDNPADLFTSFFGGAPGGAPVATMPAAPAAMPPAPTPDQKLATSILDTVVSEYQFYTSDRSNLSMASKSKLSDHLDAVRQLENRISGVSLVGGNASGASCKKPGAPASDLYVSVHHNGAASGGNVVAADFVKSFKVMADLWTMAVGCDLFRFGFTVTCCAGDGVAFTGPYNVAGQMVDMTAAGETHGTNHAMGDAPADGNGALIHNGWHTHLFLECTSYVMEGLDKFTDSNGKTILENALVMMGTDLGTNHSGRSVFYGVSSANGKFKPGLYDVTGTLADFLASCGAAMGLGGTPTMTGFIA